MSAGDMREVIGLADGCELMSALTRFPDDDMAAAVVNGSVRDDAVGCAKDVAAARDGGRADGIEALCEGFACAAGEDAEELGAALRRAWSLLYARQGSGVAIFPYESAFVHVREGLPGAPALFRTALTLRVEKAMRESGVLPKDAETEPCDSAWNEWAFLSFLLGSEATALEADDEDAAALWRGRASDFVREHAASWLPDFLARTAEVVDRLALAGKVDPSAARFYGALTAYGHFLLTALAEREA